MKIKKPQGSPVSGFKPFVGQSLPTAANEPLLRLRCAVVRQAIV